MNQVFIQLYQYLQQRSWCILEIRSKKLPLHMNAEIIRDFLKINNSIIYLKLTQQYCQLSIKKTNRSRRPEVFCEKVQSLIRPATLLKKTLRRGVFL